MAAAAAKLRRRRQSQKLDLRVLERSKATKISAAFWVVKIVTENLWDSEFLRVAIWVSWD